MEQAGDGFHGGDVLRLPSGRHRLPRSYVVGNQRARILQAAIEVVGTNGYAQFTVDAVVAKSAVSKKTFYEHFKNKDDAFLAAYDSIAERGLQAVIDSVDDRAPLADRLRAGLGAFLEFMAGEPLAARMCVVEVLAAGPEAIERRDRIKRFFSETIVENLLTLAPDYPEPELAAEVVVGGVHEVVFDRINRGQTHTLPELREGLVNVFAIPERPAADQ
ncbi:TetR/AcrR family transcriptional regulator [Actinomadura bangladeshensis]|jgi:AcrR family transcriptional regulator|uniref:TetR/AcrR family transcriptional regulator n=1 Tax=Actinomadura bangladeshensis TaxID=453573 RepID=A0A6L9Q8K0_9ACTN|nr:TetR/AcrR family transcriptional regulator [Actinomadura bangladeshensis]NEA21767.1 TetR/AcrR family transcriptional regulator [Actinomadura bangladeshensis]